LYRLYRSIFNNPGKAGASPFCILTQLKYGLVNADRGWRPLAPQWRNFVQLNLTTRLLFINT
jgi:hypothetical protein